MNIGKLFRTDDGDRKRHDGMDDRKVVKTIPVKKEWMTLFTEMERARQEVVDEMTAAGKKLYNLKCAADHASAEFWIKVSNDTGDKGNMVLDKKKKVISVLANPFDEMDTMSKLTKLTEEDDED
jgi:hypothetical protein